MRTRAYRIYKIAEDEPKLSDADIDAILAENPIEEASPSEEAPAEDLGFIPPSPAAPNVDTSQMNEGEKLKVKLFSAIESAAPLIAKGIAKHNLEQFWWKKLSVEENLDASFYQASLDYVANAAQSFAKEIETKMKETVKVTEDGIAYAFPIERNKILGTFTLPFPAEMTVKIDDLKNMEDRLLRNLIVQEYSKWLGTHILFNE